jgi:ornithine cyclodeaminase/alanine dehydrogenase
MNQPGVLVLSRREIAGLLTFSEYVNAVETAFSLLASGRIPGSGVLDIPAADGIFHVKGSALPDEDRLLVAVKVNGNFPDNKPRHGLPTIQGAILLCDGNRGYPLALMDSTEITMKRTGAATAVAAKYLARPGSETALICGCGTQGRIQLLALTHTLPLKRAYAFDQDPRSCADYCARMSEETRILVTPVDSVKEVSRQSDAIVTCTTSRKYFLRKEDVRPGTFIAAVGADSHEKQEIDPSLMASGKVVADILDQCVKMGDLHHAIAAGSMARQDVHAELQEIVSAAKPGRASDEEITIFDSTGTAIQDVAAAAVVYRRAIELGIGTTADLLS